MPQSKLNKYLIAFSFAIISITSFSQIGPYQIMMKGYSAWSINTEDMDNDGNMDIVFAGHRWFRNQSNNFFGGAFIIDNSYGTLSHCTGDFNGDSLIDIVSITYSSLSPERKLIYHQNAGNNNFQPSVLLKEQDNLRAVYIADMDNDSVDDIIWQNHENIGWRKNDGQGFFSPIDSIQSPVNSRMAVGDIDNDIDIIYGATSWSPYIVCAKNSGSGHFPIIDTIANLSGGMEKIILHDMNFDGNKDIIYSKGSGIYWMRNLGNGAFSNEESILQNIGTHYDICIGFIDSDTIPDIVSSNYGSLNPELFWIKNNGDDTFQSKVTITTNVTQIKSIDAADFDNDGDVDIICSGSNNGAVLALFINDNTSFSSINRIYPSYNNLLSVKASDINKNGLDDVVTASYDQQIMFHEKRYGRNDYEIKLIAKDSNYIYSIDIGELSNDSLQDVIVDNTVDSIIYYLQNNGIDSIFSRVIIDSSIYKPTNSTILDLDYDGLNDILSISNGNDIIWYKNLSSSFGNKQIINSTPGAESLAYGDLNNDGFSDIVIGARSTGTISCIFNNGNGSFSPELMIDNAANVVDMVQLGDLDNDSFNDILCVLYIEKKIQWYRNLGDSTFAAPVVLHINSSGTYPKFVYSFDVDHDNDLDIIGLDLELFWLENDGAGNFGTAIYFTGPQLPNEKEICFSDMDGNGHKDIIVGSGTTGHEQLSFYPDLTESDYRAKGFVFYDINQNALHDSLEPGVDISISVQPINSSTFVYNNNQFMIALDSGSYEITYNPDSNWVLSTDSNSYHISLNSTNQIEDSLIFGFYPDSVFISVNPILTAANSRCNEASLFWLNYKNNGTQVHSGIIELQIPSAVNYLTASILPDSIIGDNYYWHYDSLNFSTENQIIIQVQNPSFLFMGDSLISTITISALDSNNNIMGTFSDSLIQIVTCAYDPNDKLVSPIGYESPKFITGTEKLEYTVRFQNTGNDTAYNILIHDNLSQHLDWNTLTPIASSSPVRVNLLNSGLVELHLDSIMLPDSNTNELASHGFIKYEINPLPNLYPNTMVENYADIYFDYNPPVITNTIVNTIIDCNSFKEIITNDTLFCFGDSIIGYNDKSYIENYKWNIDNSLISTDSLLNYVPTLGIHNLTLNISNPLCNVDTTITIEVHNKFPLANITNIGDTIFCNGNSVLLLSDSTVGNNWYYNNTLYSNSNQITPTTSGTYYLENNFNGCLSNLDSIEVIANNNTSNNIINTSCNSFIAPSGNIYSSSGIYFDTIPNTNGCDSIISIDLTISHGTSSNLTEYSCFTYLSPNGFNYMNSGTYIDTITNSNGCDSIITINLTVNTVDTTITQTGIVLAANNIGATYQWINCDSSSTLLGEINQSFTPTLNGNYAVQLIENGCIDTSACYLINNVGLIESTFENDLVVYPNPTDGFLKIDLGGSFGAIDIKVIDIDGKVVVNKQFGNRNIFNLDLTTLANGVYIVKLKADDKEAVLRVVKEE